MRGARITMANALDREFKGHTGSVWCLQVVGDTLFTGSDDSTVRRWSRSSGETVGVYKGHSDWVNCLQVVDELLYTGSNDSTVRDGSIASINSTINSINYCHNIWTIHFTPFIKKIHHKTTHQANTT